MAAALNERNLDAVSQKEWVYLLGSSKAKSFTHSLANLVEDLPAATKPAMAPAAAPQQSPHRQQSPRRQQNPHPPAAIRTGDHNHQAHQDHQEH